MTDEKVVAEHYHHGTLLSSIEKALAESGKPITDLKVSDLAPVDEFHIGGREATEHLVESLTISTSDKLLDIGCGLGGAARFMAEQFGCQISGVDLTQEYVETGQALNDRVGLGHQVKLHNVSALDMPFNDSEFDTAYMLHVGMNIEAKGQLFKEIGRVLKPGASYAIYDVMRVKAGELEFPLPWASKKSFSYLASPDQYVALLEASGFEVVSVTDRMSFALEFFGKLKALAAQSGGPPPLGLHVLMGDTTGMKIQNMTGNINRGIISPVQIIARRL